MYRQRALKFALVISLHIGLAALLLYVSLNNPIEEKATPSLKVSLLKEAQPSNQPLAKTLAQQPAPKVTTKPKTYPHERQQQTVQHDEPVMPKPPVPSTSNSTSPSSPANAAASSAVTQKEEPHPAQAPSQSVTDTPMVSVDCPYRPLPSYPDSFNGKHEKGEVHLSISITAKGTIDAVEITKSSGFPILDETARDTVLKKWRCVPAHQNDKNLAGKAYVLIQFESK